MWVHEFFHPLNEDSFLCVGPSDSRHSLCDLNLARLGVLGPPKDGGSPVGRTRVSERLLAGGVGDVVEGHDIMRTMTPIWAVEGICQVKVW